VSKAQFLAGRRRRRRLATRSDYPSQGGTVPAPETTHQPPPGERSLGDYRVPIPRGAGGWSRRRRAFVGRQPYI
jgi:hypothetical protein